MRGGADRFQTAARAYFGYGVVYWIGGVYLASRGIGVRGGDAIAWRGVAWIVVGLGLVLLIPYLLRRRRRWFERWLLSRRDFARVLSGFMAYRAIQLIRIASTPDGGSVPVPGLGELSFRLGASVFFVVTVVALCFVVRAAWQPEPVDDRATN